MNKEIIEKILNIAVYAPSGDNSQPWRFIVKDNLIEIYSLPEKDNPIFNYRGRGTLLAHGALIENIIIAAKEFGYFGKLEVLPDPQDMKHIANIILCHDQTGEKDPLYKFIQTRATNRKFYKNISLTSEQKTELLNAANAIKSGTVMLSENAAEKTKLGKAVAANEIIMLEHKDLHDFFYNDVRWTTKAERAIKTGLYLKTMELALPQLVIFKLLQYWPIAKVLNRIGIARFIASLNSKLYGSASAIGIIAVEDQDEEFVTAGRITQRIWLKADRLGLAFHPVTGIVYLAQRVLKNEAEAFSAEHAEIIKNAYQGITSVFPVGNKVIAMLFRLGIAPASSGTSSRLKPQIEFK